MAIAAEVPLVPAAVYGTKDILPKGTLRIVGGRKVALVLGEPIPTAGLTLKNRDDLTERTRDAVKGLLEKARARVEG